jgi:hypothetical protein
MVVFPGWQQFFTGRLGHGRRLCQLQRSAQGAAARFLAELKPFLQNNLEKAPNFGETALDQYG